MKKLVFFLITTFWSVGMHSQTLNDSITVLYKNYFELLKTKDKLDTISLEIKKLKTEYQGFTDILESNNKQIKKLTDAELFSLKDQIDQKRKKIINTTDFVFSANASLNAIKQLDATSDYLSQISRLNNPENSELGFSLSSEVEKIIESKIIKGNSKINGVKKSKFLNFVDNIIKSPISVSLYSAIPVVSSIKSVIDLVMGNALQGDDISIQDVVEVKKSLKVYSDHYEGLAKAQSDFEQNLGNLDIRKEGMVLLLTQYTYERVHTLSPSMIAEDDKNLSLTKIINKYYNKELIEQRVDFIIGNNTSSNYNNSLTNNNLAYPTYALNQAKFIRDEIESLSKEYISIYASYQLSLKNVLEKSKNIGDATRINEKIKELETKLSEVKVSFEDNLNIDRLNTTFTTLMQY